MRMNFALKVEENPILETKVIETKKGKMRIYRQEMLILLNFHKRDMFRTYKLDLVPDSELLAPGYYVLTVEIDLDKFGKPFFPPFSPIMVYPIKGELPENYVDLDIMSVGQAHKSVLNERVFDQPANNQSQQVQQSQQDTAALIAALGMKQQQQQQT